MLSSLGFLLAPQAEARFWAVPIGVAQEVGGRRLHLEEVCGCMTREGEDGRELCSRGEREVISWLMPDLPFLEKSVTNLGTQVGVGPGEV